MTGEVTVREAAEQLHKSPSTVQRMIASGLLRARKAFGGRTAAYLLNKDDVDRLAAELAERRSA